MTVVLWDRPDTRAESHSCYIRRECVSGESIGWQLDPFVLYYTQSQVVKSHNRTYCILYCLLDCVLYYVLTCVLWIVYCLLNCVLILIYLLWHLCHDMSIYIGLIVYWSSILSRYWRIVFYCYKYLEYSLIWLIECDPWWLPLGPIRKLNPVFDYSCTQNRIVDE